MDRSRRRTIIIAPRDGGGDGRRRPNELLEAGRGRRGRAREARARGGTERLVGRPRRKAKFAEEDVPNFVQGISPRAPL